MDYGNIRGFNYQPSFGSTGFEIWQNYNLEVVKKELGLGKKYFPNLSAIRLWLSWDSFIRNPQKFAANFEGALAIATGCGIAVMPVLFNRWHDTWLDYGGIYLDHFYPGASWVQRPEMFDDYINTIVGGHATDPRIFAWDLCNEPFAYGQHIEKVPKEWVESEFAWMKNQYDACKKLGAKAPVTVGIHPGHGRGGIAQIEPISDLLSIHPYWTYNERCKHDKKEYEAQLDMYVAFSKEVGKPLLATETVWGAEDDALRVEIIRYTLGELKKRNIGWLAYLLHHSLIADAHRAEYGPVGGPGNLSFIEADGTLRPGHDVFNEY